MRRRSQGWIVLLSFLIGASANAAFTVNNCSHAVVCNLSSVSDTKTQSFSNVIHIDETTSSILNDVDTEFLRLPVAFRDASASPCDHAKSLPDVPGAISLVLAGLFCISLVKDHSIWLAALAFLLWLGQAGFDALPQLTSRLHSVRRSNQKSFQNTGHLSKLGNSLFVCGNSASGNMFPHKPAIITTHYSTELFFNFQALKPELPVLFSPASIFVSLARGPPKTLLEKGFFQAWKAQES